jgi:capsular polysaccharide biosynthesis protein
MEKLTKINYFFMFKRRWAFITTVTLLVVLLSLVFTLLQPFRYESSVKILIIQKSTLGFDAYSASKSAERIGQNLSQVIYSSSFLSKVLNAGYEIDKSYFPADEEKKRDEWSRLVAADVGAGTTILNIAVYHPNREQATIIATAITSVLQQNAGEYIGYPDVELKIVDEPLTSNYPVKPNVILNLVLGFVAGFFLAISILLVTYSEEREIDALFKMQNKKSRRINDTSFNPPLPAAKSPKSDFRREELPKRSSTPKTVEPDFELAFRKDNPAGNDFTKTHRSDFKEQKDSDGADELNNKLSEYKELPGFKDEDEIQTLYK